MATLVLIYGKSGTGKSTSLRNFKKGEIGIINVLNKPLPFKNDLPVFASMDYDKIKQLLFKPSEINSYIVDDFGFLQTDEFMGRHSKYNKGNDVFVLYNELADNVYNFMLAITNQLPKEKIVYLTMHEELTNLNEIKIRTIGKLLDEKVGLDAMTTIVLNSLYKDKQYLFRTQTNGVAIAKSPIGLFDTEFIDNDLKMVDDKIREFYNL